MVGRAGTVRQWESRAVEIRAVCTSVRGDRLGRRRENSDVKV